jgi:steroid delta-isomerase-like uncharacterized protein
MKQMNVIFMTMIFCIFFTPGLLAQASEDAHQHNEDLLEAFISSLNDHDAEQFSMLFTDSCQYIEINSGRVFTGREAVAVYISSTLKGMPDSHFEIVRLMANDHLGMVEWLWKGTNSVGWPQLGIPATDQHMELNGVSVIDFQDGKIDRNRDYWDNTSFLKGIGVQ